MKRRGVRWMAVAMAVTALAAGCGEENKVGDERLLDFEEQVGERLGETTTTTAAPTTTTVAGPAQAAQNGGTKATATTATTRSTPVTAAAPVTTATTAPKQEIPVAEIFIYDDNAPAAIEPQYARQFVGAVVRWVNKDTVARGVKATTTRFPCENIPPGGSCEYKPTAPGIFDYGDSTRPYVNGTLEVLSRDG